MEKVVGPLLGQIAWQIETKQPEMLACSRQPDLRAIGSRGMIRGFAGVIPYRAGGAPLQLSGRSNPCVVSPGTGVV